MTPSTWASFLFFAYFLVPGLYLDLLTRRHHAGYHETALAEIGRIFLGSSVFSAVGLLIIALTKWAFPSWILDPGRLLKEKNYFADNYRLVFWTFFVEELFALLAVWLYDNYIIVVKSPQFTTSHHWNMLFQDEPPETVENSHRTVRNAIKFALSGKERLQKSIFENVIVRKAIKFIIRRKIDPTEDESTGPDVSEILWTFRVVKVTLNTQEEVVGFASYWSLEESMADREMILTSISEQQVDRLPEEIQEVARRDSSTLYTYIPIQSVEKIRVYEVPFPI
ncbi:MAG: DUF6338 family protein [Candidatus Nanopelagicaceae bacterium]